LTNMGWENYIRGDPNYLEPLDVTLILVIFSVISLASFLGGSILFLWDFEEPKFQFHNLPNILLNIFSEQKDVILGLVVLLIIPLIIWVVFFLFCWVKRSYIKNLDQPKKLNKINPYWHLLTIQIPIVFEIIREKCTFWGFRIFKRYPKKYIDLRLEKKRKQLEKIIENLIKQLQSLRTNNNLTQNKLNYFIKQLQSMKKKLQKVSSKKIDNLDFFPNKLNFMLDTMYFMLPRIFDFVLINTEIYQKSKFQNSKKLKKFKKFQKIEKSINKLSRKIIILQHINRWSNPKFRFESIFEDIVDDMWK
ncbi:MAG: hypothetical protein QNJ64_04815, partial [Crocosphaera sp.]|nr:hypothetical protein [Crocosphaera sp.]